MRLECDGKVDSLVRRLLGLVTIAAALYGLGCTISFVFPSIFRTDPDQFYSWALRIMAAASFGLTLCLALSAVNLICKPSTVDVADCDLRRGVVIPRGSFWNLSDLLSDSARLSFARAVGIANTGLTPLQMLHIPMVGTTFCGFVMYLSRKVPDAVRVSNEVDG